MTNFYEDHHLQYYQETVDIDPAPFLEPLRLFLKPHAAILDIGCGSGRDLLWFRQHGFSVIGFEKSPSLARLARKHADCLIIEGDFSNYDFSNHSVDALTFIGSLVHQSEKSVAVVLKSTCQSLHSGGYILITMKEGVGTSLNHDGRTFTLWSTQKLEEVFTECGLEIMDFSRQISRLRPEDIWLGYVLKCSPANQAKV